jgi:DNA helicase-2/ATP-dependent DNA helicase PcrA
VVRNNTQRLEKNLRSVLGEGELVKVVQVEDEHAEARYVVGQIEAAMTEGASHGDVAVFYRTNAQSRVLEDMLTRTGRPYQVIGGPKFYERAEVKDSFGYLNAIVNPNDSLSISRVINVPKRGIGDATVARLRTYADTYGETLNEALRQAPMEGSLNAGALRRIEEFVELLDGLRDFAEKSTSIATTIEHVYEKTGLIAALQAEDTIESQGRLENLGELVNVAREYDAREAASGNQGDLAEFLQSLSLQAQGDSLDTTGGQITLMTIHNAKGLEYPIVFITGMEEGLFPHSRSIQDGDVEEERRLAYVGITRAQTKLTIVHAGSRSVFGRRQYSMPSRFLAELPDEHIEHEQLGGSANTWGGASAFGGRRGSSGASGWGNADGDGGGAFGASGWKQSSGGTRRGSGGDEFGTTFGARGGSSSWGSTDGAAASGASGMLAGGAPASGGSFKASGGKRKAPDLGAGDSILHDAFGEGVVLHVDGELAVVRFTDGNERRLMLGYAPITKL